MDSGNGDLTLYRLHAADPPRCTEHSLSWQILGGIRPAPEGNIVFIDEHLGIMYQYWPRLAEISALYYA